MKRIIALLLLVSALLMSCTGCYFEGSDDGGADTVLGNGRSVLRIVSGSENAELEPILEKFAQKENIRIEMTYLGSLDIMRLLSEDNIPYDAVWPASSLWLTVGDTNHRVKHTESISITPVVFGIRKNLAQDSAHIKGQKKQGGSPFQQFVLFQNFILDFHQECPPYLCFSGEG